MTRKEYYLEQLQGVVEVATNYINNYCDENELTQDELDEIELGNDDIANAILHLYSIADSLSMK